MISVPELYNVINKYFDNPLFVKIKDTGIYSLYVCKLNSSLGNINRYLICITDRDVFFPGYTIFLRDIKWKIFQTRGLTETYPTVKNKHSYFPKQGGIYSSVIRKMSSNNHETRYSSVDIPAEISLLTDDRNLYDYPDTGMLNSALETYNLLMFLQ
jgi:hypothetical protein